MIGVKRETVAQLVKYTGENFEEVKAFVEGTGLAVIRGDGRADDGSSLKGQPYVELQGETVYIPLATGGALFVPPGSYLVLEGGNRLRSESEAWVEAHYLLNTGAQEPPPTPVPPPDDDELAIVMTRSEPTTVDPPASPTEGE